MKNRADKRIVESLIANGVVPSEDKDLYVYGVGQGIVILINLLSVVIIGLIFGMIWHSVVFMIAYIPIRSYAGGYHATTQLRCYLLSDALIIAVLLVIRLIPWNSYVSFAIAICATIIIFLVAPVEDLNKPLRDIEKKVFRKKTRIILLALLAIALILWFFVSEQLSVSIILVLLVVAVMLILGLIKNSRCKGDEY